MGIKREEGEPQKRALFLLKAMIASTVENLPEELQGTGSSLGLTRIMEKPIIGTLAPDIMDDISLTIMFWSLLATTGIKLP